MTGPGDPTSLSEGVIQGFRDLGWMAGAMGDALTDGEMLGYFARMFIAAGIPMAIVFGIAYLCIQLTPSSKKKSKKRNSR